MSNVRSLPPSSSTGNKGEVLDSCLESTLLWGEVTHGTMLQDRGRWVPSTYSTQLCTTQARRVLPVSWAFPWAAKVWCIYPLRKAFKLPPASMRTGPRNASAMGQKVSRSNGVWLSPVVGRRGYRTHSLKCAGILSTLLLSVNRRHKECSLQGSEGVTG